MRFVGLRKDMSDESSRDFSNIFIFPHLRMVFTLFEESESWKNLRRADAEKGVIKGKSESSKRFG